MMSGRWKALHFVQRLFFTISVLVLVSLVLYQGIQCLIRFKNYPTYISTEIVNQKDANFPVITICPDGRVKYKPDVLKKYGYPHRRNYNRDNITTWHGYPNDALAGVHPSKVFDELIYHFWELIEEITITLYNTDARSGNLMEIDGTSPARNITTKEKIVVNENNNRLHHVLDVTEQRHRSFGQCYTLNVKGVLRQFGIRVITIKYKSQVKQYIHAPNQYTNSNGRMGVKIYPGEVIANQVNYMDIRMLEKKTSQRSKSDKSVMCTADSDFDGCIYSMLERLMVNKSNCTSPWVPNNRNICRKPKDISAVFNISFTRNTNQFGDCDQPCNFFLVTIGSKNRLSEEEYDMEADHDDTSYPGKTCLQIFYFPEHVIVNQEHFLYNFLSMMAEIGGNVGLLLGFSILEFVQIIQKWLNEKYFTNFEEFDNRIQHEEESNSSTYFNNQKVELTEKEERTQTTASD